MGAGFSDYGTFEYVRTHVSVYSIVYILERSTRILIRILLQVRKWLAFKILRARAQRRPLLRMRHKEMRQECVHEMCAAMHPFAHAEKAQFCEQGERGFLDGDIDDYFV